MISIKFHSKSMLSARQNVINVMWIVTSMKTRKGGFDFCAIYTKFALERTILPLFKSKGSEHSVDNLRTCKHGNSGL